MRRLATVLSLLIGLFCLSFGSQFLLDPETAAAGYGIPAWPRGDAAGYFWLKAFRDLADGVVVLALLALGHRRALAWVLLLFAIAPFGDATTVIAYGGPYATALGVHAATGVTLLVTAGLLFAGSSEDGKDGTVSNPREREGIRSLDRSVV
ncbi:DUF4267 domain-containing protein [Streptomyces sp. NPDC097704]|uniref:DUF4267 domain-containing protein n=1 Tax=Streptomyces sp. NPDC097704 TaxID=3157101 RepID=UPI0033233B32